MGNGIHKLKRIAVLNKVWVRYRLKRILRKHKQVAAFWTPLIHNYFERKIEKNIPRLKKAVTEKVIWQYWGQGVTQDKLPEVVKICFDSVDKWRDDYTIIRLSDETVKEYVDLPDFVWEKLESGIFNKTFFSDLLRLALLRTYGGIWMDATVLLTGPVPEAFNKQDYFMFQRDPAEKRQSYWTNSYAYYWGWHDNFKVRVLNSVIFAKKDSAMISTLYDLMLYYWKIKNSVMDYFFFQILYNELISGRYASHKCDVVSDALPHLLQTKINGQFDELSFDEIFTQISIHKLTYFDENGINKLKKVLHNPGMP